MPKFEQLLDTIGGPPKYGEDENELSIEARKYNRRMFITTRRSLPIAQRRVFDQLVRFALHRTIAIWSGALTLDYSDLGELVRDGWARQHKI